MIVLYLFTEIYSTGNCSFHRYFLLLNIIYCSLHNDFGADEENARSTKHLCRVAGCKWPDWHTTKQANMNHENTIFRFVLAKKRWHENISGYVILIHVWSFQMISPMCHLGQLKLITCFTWLNLGKYWRVGHFIFYIFFSHEIWRVYLSTEPTILNYELYMYE
jgi:hypothetical protein